MKQFIKDWLLPPKIKDLVSSQISIYKTKKLGVDVIKKNIELKDKYKGKRCFILGNAPSIKEIDLEFLKDEYVFVMSTFYNHPDFYKLKKCFHSSVHLTGSNDDKKNLKWLKAIDDNSPNVNIFFFGLKEKRLIEKNNLFKNKQVYYIASAQTKRSFDITKITRNYATNVIQALEIAIYMGFKEIYLHSVNINSICSNKYEYFFDRNKLPYCDPAVKNNICLDYMDQVKSFYIALKEIYVVYRYALNKGVNIYYTNSESLLKYFPFKNFSEIIEKGKQ